MCISKRVSNTGASGNHGMSEIDVQNELAKAEKALRDEHKGWTFSCGNGCKYTMSKKYTARQVARAELFVEQHCVHCNGWKNPMVHAVINELVKHVLPIGGEQLSMLRYPTNFRPRKIYKVEPVAAEEGKAESDKIGKQKQK